MNRLMKRENGLKRNFRATSVRVKKSLKMQNQKRDRNKSQKRKIFQKMR